jgi:hypothetical protein
LAIERPKGTTGLGELDPNQLPLDLFEFNQSTKVISLKDGYKFLHAVLADDATHADDADHATTADSATAAGNADTLDNAHADVAPTAGEIPILDGAGLGAFDISGNAATATSATSAENADTVDGAHASVTPGAGDIPILDDDGAAAIDITGNAVTADDAADSAMFGGKSPANFLLDYVYPVGCYYTQYPDAASNTDATEFPEAQRPATLFGGTWAEQWATESVYFRTRGTLSDSGRVNGSQPDAFQGHYHRLAFNMTTRRDGATNTGIPDGGLGTTQDTNVTVPIADPSNGTPRTAAETRVVNRRIKVWKRTA